MVNATTAERLVNDFRAAVQEIEFLKESMDRRVLDIEDIGWIPLNGKSPDDTGLSLEALRDHISEKLRDAAAVNPLHVRGAQLRHSYVFGRGINFTDIEEKTQKIIDNPYNREKLFSVQAYETNNLALFTDGNLFVIRDEKTNIFTVVPISQIYADITDPDDPSKVRYFLRQWNDGKETRKRWYPIARYKKTIVGRGRRGAGLPETITVGNEKVPVAQNAVMYHHTTKRQAGWTYGVPDSLAAAVWSVAYTNYLTDNAQLVKALSQLAWAVTTSTKSGQSNAAIQVATQTGIGGTAVMGSGNQLSSVGVPSAQVDFNNGQPLAALVAASFGVPVIALLSSPGATGGSYGAAQTLDEPTLNGMKAIQDSWKLFYEEILADIGSPNGRASFPNITQDPTYRNQASLSLAYETGALHQDEYRDTVLEILDVQKKHQELPESPAAREERLAKSVAAQGNTGAVPGGTNQGVTNHDDDASRES